VSKEVEIPATAIISTYPPRRCGIAEFSHDLAGYLPEREIVALQPPQDSEPYPPEVRHVIRRDVLPDYYRIAHALNECGAEVVSLQHEFGIWGGDSGSFVIDFLSQLRLPVVATLHTVLHQPSPAQREIIEALVAAAAKTVVMSNSAAALMTANYGVSPDAMAVIPHGVHGLPLTVPGVLRRRMDLGDGPVILSFGLIGPGKGYESVIEAMPEVAAMVPSVRYVVLGATHPDVVRRDGEKYRQGLEARVAELGVVEQVRFVNRFVGKSELVSWLSLADIFVTPYPNMEQIVSGTLAYAMGAGRAIVSTPYTYAAEMLSDDRGILVEPGSPAALSAAFIELLRNDRLRLQLGHKAYEFSRSMLWPEVAARYEQVLDEALQASGRRTLPARTRTVQLRG
jgi:glycosyltransferase involved in cell wall biosynthesis